MEQSVICTDQAPVTLSQSSLCHCVLSGMALSSQLLRVFARKNNMGLWRWTGMLKTCNMTELHLTEVKMASFAFACILRDLGSGC